MEKIYYTPFGPKFKLQINNNVCNIYFYDNNNFSMYLYHDNNNLLAHCYGCCLHRKINYFFYDVESHNQHYTYTQIEETIKQIELEIIKIFKLKSFI